MNSLFRKPPNLEKILEIFKTTNYYFRYHCPGENKNVERLLLMQKNVKEQRIPSTIAKLSTSSPPYGVIPLNLISV